MSEQRENVKGKTGHQQKRLVRTAAAQHEPASRHDFEGVEKLEQLPEHSMAQSLRQATLLQLQRKHGNAYVQRMLAHNRAEAKQTADAHRAGPALSKLPNRGPAIQRDFAGSFPTSQGVFEMDMISQHGAVTGGKTGMRGTITFNPNSDAPYSNKIGLIQIVKLTDGGGSNVNPVTLPATTGPHVRTDEDKAAGVEKGFFTDVEHNKHGPGDALLPYYPFAPLSRKSGDIFGFKRSKNPADIKEAVLFDFPGITSNTANLKFNFETAAKADDTMNVYGVVKWSFDIEKGKVVNEDMSVLDGQSSTFDAALEKHRDFYVHEPVTFYFDFDSDILNSTESAKIDTFLAYLDRFPDVMLDLTGFADLRGSPDYNRRLALRRAESVAQALIRKGVDPARIKPPRAVGETTDFTKNATTDQDEEANRRGNRRVRLVFEHTASIAP